jgi:DNA-binding IclR family transcriptional regulator
MNGKSKHAASRDQVLAKAVKESKSPAIARAAAILRLLGKADTPLGLQSIARELGLVPSTCLYTLRALVAEEFVAFEPDTKRYSLEAGVLTLARHWRSLLSIVSARPSISRLWECTLSVSTTSSSWQPPNRETTFSSVHR